MNKRKNRMILILLCLILGCLSFGLLFFGSVIYEIPVIWKVLCGEDIKGATFAIQTLRLPRMLGGLLSGLAFGMAGYTFQTMLRNPLASPDVIGVSGGTSLAAIFCMIVLSMSGSKVSGISVVAGFVVAILIYFLSGTTGGRSYSGDRFILVGIGVQAMISATLSYVLLRASQYDIPGAMRWLSGSLNGIQIKEVYPLLMVVIISGGILLLLHPQLEIMELGEQMAITLGVKTNQMRIIFVLVSTCLIGFATTVTGPIAFVAFLSGPIAIKLTGKGKYTLLSSGLIGAILVLGADLIGQFGFGTRFPVGVITGILGAPYLLFLLIQKNRRGIAT